MLDKLVVSKNSTKENKRIGNFLITSSLAMVSVLTVGLIYSLFTYNLAMGNENISISTLVAPVLETEAKPLPPKEKVKPNKRVSENTPNVAIRKTNTLRIEESPTKVPDKASVTPSSVKARPKGYFNIGKVNKDAKINSSVSSRTSDNNTSSIVSAVSDKGDDNSQVVKKPEIKKPPVLPKEPPKQIVKKPTGPVSGGVVNGKAKRLVQPTYSQAAKTMNVGGKVTVQVLIDENGNVISAKAVDGHPLLRNSAVRAARSSKFTPTTLSGQKVKVSGVILYNFVK